MSDYNVETINDGLNEFNVEFHGPKESTFLTLMLLFPYHVIYIFVIALIVMIPVRVNFDIGILRITQKN